MSSTDNAPAVHSEITSETIRDLKLRASALIAELAKVYQGPESVIELLVIALLARGHVLIEGVPGVAKTTLVKAFAATQSATFSRVQFTPDLLPSDITGTHILQMQSNEMVLRRGPIFAHVVLGDEINRAPAKTQSALLEAMGERQVTIEGVTLPLPDPFIVLATQNPVEQEGVFPLPEAQLDRFLITIHMGYPTAKDEIDMLRRHEQGPPRVSVLWGPEEVRAMAAVVTKIRVGDAIRAYVVGLARATRAHSACDLGASPRASLALVRACRARAALRGRDYVNVDDVRALLEPVFAHRLIITPNAAIAGTSPSDVLRTAVREVPYDPA